jgi:uncharacterized protein (UPF0332 family)
MDRKGRPAKTHGGVWTEFARLTVDEPGMNAELRAFLPRAYNLKTAADYEFGPGSDIPLGRAAAAVEEAARFLDCITALLG